MSPGLEAIQEEAKAPTMEDQLLPLYGSKAPTPRMTLRPRARGGACSCPASVHQGAAGLTGGVWGQTGLIKKKDPHLNSTRGTTVAVPSVPGAHLRPPPVWSRTPNMQVKAWAPTSHERGHTWARRSGR